MKFKVGDLVVVNPVEARKYPAIIQYMGRILVVEKLMSGTLILRVKDVHESFLARELLPVNNLSFHKLSKFYR